MRRRLRGPDGMPDYLARYDWRDWREPAAPDDPFPEYTTWYLGLFEWQAARKAWAAGRDVSARKLPRTVPPPRGALTSAAASEPGPLPPNRGPSVHRSRPIKLR